ncbi:MAG: MoxR family ATPase [Ferroplasma sp.]|uniref:AAA family ATPase n=1 Tax=Ferroplasma sp. TaxID=2591003 RepID=UPI0028157805|nr:MoxR family ATPase [Ferroplasma sp.]WMT51939.1 MAG: MoxR family ATPase [Ferroplasma sp.]
MEEETKTVRDIAMDMETSIDEKVIGSRRIVRFMLISLFTNNHILMEGVPGLAKTMLASEFSKHLGLQFKRIQFTPDMLPSDVTGNMVFNPETRKMEFREGPVFSNIVLADEINRTPPKVQSALLEAMEEKQVSVYGITTRLPSPFLVIATQNPIEQEGTFPLAEALMDRFLFRYYLDYPDRDDEVRILESAYKNSIQAYSKLDAETIMNFRKMVENVYVNEDIIEYIINVIRKTRESDMVFVGASTRTAVKYLQAARANALLSGRNYVIPEDIIFMAKELLNHRLILRPEALMDSDSDYKKIVYNAINSIINSVEAPQ